MWIIYGLLSALGAAGVVILAKFGVNKLDTTLATTVRSVVMAVFLVSFALFFGKAKLLHTIDNKALIFIIFSGISGALSWLFYFLALKTGPATGVVAVDKLSVVFVLILAVLFLGEQLTWKTGLGALLISAGAIFMSLR
jgi:transporter family protein